MSGNSHMTYTAPATPETGGTDETYNHAYTPQTPHLSFTDMTPRRSPNRTLSPLTTRKAPTIPPTSFSTYLSARPFMPPTRPAQTLNHFDHTAPLAPLTISHESNGALIEQDAEDGQLTERKSLQSPESHYDRWTRHWTKDVIALNTGMRRPPVLPISEKARELIELEHERRKAETDARIVRNRIMALQEQERRVLVKTTQAQERLHSLHRIKAMKDSKKGFRDELKAVHAMQLYQEAQNRRQQEHARLENYRNYRKQIQELKAARARQAQLERVEMEQRRRQVQAAQQSARAEQFKLVRGFETLARQRIQQEELMRKAEIERIRAERALTEQQRRAAALEAAQEMIKEEEQLLQRLAIRRQQHAEAFETLAVELQPSIRNRGATSARGSSTTSISSNSPPTSR